MTPENSDDLDDALFLPPPERKSSLADPRSRSEYKVTLSAPEDRPKAFVNWKLVGVGLAMLAFNLALFALGTVWVWGWAAAAGFILVGVFVGEH